MALDVGNFTLSFQRRATDPTILDLFHLAPPTPFAYASSSSSTSNAVPLPYYTYQRARVPTYRAVLLDPITDSPLAEGQTAASSLLSRVSSPTSASDPPNAPKIRPTDKELQRLAKSRSLRLFNPDAAVEIEKKRNTFSQEWVWKWEGETFVWHKDSGVGPAKATYTLEVSRKPEPDIAAAIYKPQSRPFASSPGLDVGIGPLSTSEPHNFLQIFSYNLQRLDISDRRGLEVALVMSLLALLDMEYDERAKGGGNVYGAQREWLEEDVGSLATATSQLSLASQGPLGSLSGSAPSSARQLERNEVLIDLYGSESTFVSHALMLLRSDEGGDKCPFIMLRAEGRETIQKAVRVAAEVKRGWYRLPVSAKGPPLDESDTSGELHQYVQSQEIGNETPAAASGASGPAATTADPNRPAVRERIKLNEPPKESSPSNPSSPGPSASSSSAPYVPPQSLTIWLSKMRLPELESKAKPAGVAGGGTSSPSTSTSHAHARVSSGGGTARPGGGGGGAGAGTSGRPTSSFGPPGPGNPYNPPRIPPKTRIPASAPAPAAAPAKTQGNAPMASHGAAGATPSTAQSAAAKIGGGVSRLLGKIGGGGGASGGGNREGSSGSGSGSASGSNRAGNVYGR